MMQITFGENGTLTLVQNGKTLVSDSPVGLLLVENTLYAPQTAVFAAGQLKLSYEMCEVRLAVKFRANGSCRLEVTEIPESADGFVFGPWRCAEAQSFGEELGAAWFADGAVVCIQSLNPKTVGGHEIYSSGGHTLRPVNRTGYPDPCVKAAGKAADGRGVLLQCTARNMSREERYDFEGMQNALVAPVPGEDGQIRGAAVVLTAAESADGLLADISALELEEGLPHPTIDGEWAKTSPKAKEPYFVISTDIPRDEQLRMAARAGVRSIYYGDPFASWGHFEINRRDYPGGEEEFCAFIADAKSHGVDVGFHTLSNFIQPQDAYVTPVPHPELLVMDTTELREPIGAEDTELYVAHANNFAKLSPLQIIRIGDELICYDHFDAERLCLCGCRRGMFGTKADAYAAGTAVLRLWDHGYRTLFPTLALQGTMADRIGDVIAMANVRRMSFDGLEGCKYTGRGEYACSEYVRRVFSRTGSELLCDASIPSHYRWHAHSYFNWGEPHYEHNRRGGMYNYRAKNQLYFQRNLLPGMLGWYTLWTQTGRYEATTPENMEFILSRMVAFDAGMCLTIDNLEHGMTDAYLDLLRMWCEFIREVDVPETLRRRMQAEHSDWHLEKTDGGWVLSERTVVCQSLPYNDRAIVTESGTAGYQISQKQAENGVYHQTVLVMDASSPNPEEIPFVTEPFCCRIRVGTALDKGSLSGLAFYTGWHGLEKLLSFPVEAEAGDYLVYEGGLTLKHYDGNFHLKETIGGEGSELIMDGSNVYGLTIHYTTEGDDMDVTITTCRTKERFVF
ncbi:MAG: hypothetical protein IJC93_10955 [Clostridia bacterium]|nr:hypothetical protein [Clostridia bacterium]